MSGRSYRIKELSGKFIIFQSEELCSSYRAHTVVRTMGRRVLRQAGQALRVEEATGAYTSVGFGDRERD
jgi:hypothetical protein